MAKYSNVKELAEAFDAGELKRDEWGIRVDNDSSHLSWIGPEPDMDADEDAYFAFGDQKYEEGEKMWDGPGPEELAIEALGALGIHAERV